MNTTKIKGIALVSLLAISLGPRPSPGQSKSNSESGAQKQKQPHVMPPKGKPQVKAKIDPDVYGRLEKSRNGRVYVMVTLKQLPKEAVSDGARRKAAKKSQDEFIAKMATDEFEIGYRHGNDPVLFAYVSSAGLQQMARNQDVRSVRYKVEPGVHEKLSASSDGTVRVHVRLKQVGRGIKELELRKARVKSIQDEVLSKLSDRDFELAWRYQIYESLGGYATQDGVELLAKDDNVIGIGISPNGVFGH